MDIQKLGGMYGNSAAITGGASASEAAQLQGEIGKFQSLLDSMKASSNHPNMQGNVASSQIAQSGRLNGEYTSGFDGSFYNEDVLFKGVSLRGWRRPLYFCKMPISE